MCIQCAYKWDKYNKSLGAVVTTDPASRQPLEQCPYCEELMTVFNRNFHYSACESAPADVAKYKDDLLREVTHNRKSRQDWQNYVTTRKTCDPDHKAIVEERLKHLADTNADYVIWTKVNNNSPDVTPDMKQRLADLRITYPNINTFLKYLFTPQTKPNKTN